VKRPRKRWLRRVWEQTAFLAELFDAPRGTRWNRFLTVALRVWICAFWVVAFPFKGLISRRADRRPVARLLRREEELWRTSPHEAVGLLYDVRARLTEAGGPIEIAPFGRFELSDKIEIELTLYQGQLALGHYEEALELSRGWPRFPMLILHQVDCLLKMKRQEEAIALLEANLHLDGRGGRLRRKLAELTPVNRGLH
jgi:hypothetical protein